MRKRWKIPISLVLIVLLSACTSLEHGDKANAEHSDKANLAKRLLDKEASPTTKALFGTTYDPTTSRLVTASEIAAWIQSENVPIAKLPDKVQVALKDPHLIGLLVPNLVPFDAEKDTRSANWGGAIFLPFIEDGDFWIHGSGPCNGNFCQNCTGCRGLGSDGLYHTCVCTNSCKVCHECPRCE